MLSVYETALAFLRQYTSGLNTVCVGPVGYILLALASIWFLFSFANTKGQVFRTRAVRTRHAISSCNLAVEDYVANVWMVNTLFLFMRESWEDLQLNIIIFVFAVSISHCRSFPWTASVTVLVCIFSLGCIQNSCMAEMDLLNGTVIACPATTATIFWEWWPLEKHVLVQTMRTQEKQSTFWGLLSSFLYSS